MKKTGCILLAAVFLLSVKMNVYAQDSVLVPEDVLESSSEFEEILLLQEEMIRWVGAGGKTENGVEIRYDRALKVYDGTGVLQMKTDNSKAILDAMEQNGHIWIVPAEKNGKRYELTVARGLPLAEDAKPYLTEYEQQKIRENEGKWTVTECVYDDDGGYQSVWDRTNAQLKNLKDCDRVILVNSLSGFQYPVLLGIKEQKAVSFAGIGYGYFVISDYEDKMQTEKGRKQNRNSVYGFKELADCAEPYFHLKGDNNSENESRGLYLLYTGFQAAVVVLALAVVYLRRQGKV